MNKKLLEIFDAATQRTESTVNVVNGWFERIPDSFYYKLRVDAKDITPYQRYYHEGKYVGSVFDFNEDEKKEIDSVMGIESISCTAFLIAPNSVIFPHKDNSPKRGYKSTILSLSGINSVLKLYSDEGDIVFESPNMVDPYTIYPKKIIHSYEVKDEEAKLINIWHL